MIANITANIDKIGHFHVADNPGRHEPGTGEINYTNVFAAIRAGFDGFVGMEMVAGGRPCRGGPQDDGLLARVTGLSGLEEVRTEELDGYRVA